MPLRILIVDDEPLVHLLYRHHLENAGYQLLSATTAQEALEATRAQNPALIVMDVMLPGTNGLAALRELKAAPATQTIPVIVITGAVDKYHESRQEAASSGAALFLTKPISPPQLVAEITRLLTAAPPTTAPNPSDLGNRPQV